MSRQAIIILVAAVWPDGPSPALIRRTIHAAKVYHEGRAAIIVPSGGLGPHPPAEAVAMTGLLVDLGVPRDAIHPDTGALTTYENLRNAQLIMQRTDVTEAIIVTDGYHSPRAVMVAKALGLTARVDAPPTEPAPLRRQVRRMRHEALALVGYRLRLAAWIRRDRLDQTWARSIS